MSDYVGIDVHRKRSQVAVVTGDGTVEFNKNVMNGSEPFLRLIGDLPSGTLVAFEAAFGWGWLAGLLEDYGFDPHLDLPPASREIVTDCLAVIDGLAPVIGRLDGELHQYARADPRVKVLTTLPGIGQFTALVMLAEIGDITRFPSAGKLASWARLTPALRGSDLKVSGGPHRAPCS